MKKILCVVLCAAMLCSVAALFAGCGKADAGEVNVYNWGEYIAEGQDGLMKLHHLRDKRGPLQHAQKQQRQL